MKQLIAFFVGFLFLFSPVLSQTVDRVEPLSWWVGMNTNLQLMLYGRNLQGADVKVLEEGLSVKAIHNAESPNYLFVDMDVRKAGVYTLEVSKDGNRSKVSYHIKSRRSGSAEREGFTTADAIYLLMPDRFANGDPSNDQLPADTITTDRSVIDGRHGGDIQGIIDHLDYIADLGVTTIWPTPLLEDNLYYHQYSCSDYYKVDPHFGTNELYREMVEKAHEKGLKVIQDIVPNHCGIGHWWMKDLPFGNWVNRFDSFTKSNYAVHSFSDPYTTEIDRELCKRGWFVETLPDLNLSNPFMLQYLIQMAVWWVEYANLDGFRVDTYFYMGEEAALWTKGIRNEYPNLGIVGEVWVNEPSSLIYWIENSGDREFNSYLPMAMDFPFQRNLVMGLSHDNEAWGGGLKSIYSLLAQDLVYDSPQTQLMTFADNHDMDRIYNMLGRSVAKTKMAMTLICTTRGTPQIYYGTELLFENDERGGPHQGRRDFPGGWKNDKLNLFEAKSRTEEQHDMFIHLTALLHFRKNNEVLHTGNLKHYLPVENVYTYFRYTEEECVMIAVNASRETKIIDWKRFYECLNDYMVGEDILTKKRITKDEAVAVPAESSLVIHFKR